MDNVIKALENAKIEYEIIYHEPVYSIEDMAEQNLLNKGYICKNLFLRNANGKVHYVISCHHSKKIDIKELATKIGSTRLSFGSDERLKKFLKLEHGYVSPFGCLNDESKSVIFIFDKDLENKTNIGFHPNTNTATILISYDNIKKIIEDHGNVFKSINL